MRKIRDNTDRTEAKLKTFDKLLEYAKEPIAVGSDDLLLEIWNHDRGRYTTVKKSACDEIAENTVWVSLRDRAVYNVHRSKGQFVASFVAYEFMFEWIGHPPLEEELFEI